MVWTPSFMRLRFQCRRLTSGWRAGDRPAGDVLNRDDIRRDWLIPQLNHPRLN